MKGGDACSVEDKEVEVSRSGVGIRCRKTTCEKRFDASRKYGILCLENIKRGSRQ